jgi:hypothetical protein
MKDFYDLYIINKMLRNNLDYPVLKMAFKNTLKNRKSEFIIDIINEVIDDIKSDDRMLNRWVEYSKSYSFTKNISFDDCVIAAIELTDIAIK